MKTIPILAILLLIISSVCAQEETDAITAAIVYEGSQLYKSEMASWYGTDLFLEKCKDQKEHSAGYLSYTYKSSGISNCLFFSKGDNPEVLATITFDSTFSVDKAVIDTKRRPFSSFEKDLYTIRTIARQEILSDSLFKTYKNTNLNLVPLIENGEKKVYILTGPTVNGVVIFGNDYLLSFDKENRLAGKKQLHRNIIPINYGSEEQTMHTHADETGDFITATDVCTLMLYEKFAKWKQHLVISDKYISIWNCDTNELLTLTRKAWDRINKDFKKRHGKDSE